MMIRGLQQPSIILTFNAYRPAFTLSSSLSPALPQDCLSGIMLGRRAKDWDAEKKAAAVVKSVMKKLFVGEL